MSFFSADSKSVTTVNTRTATATESGIVFEAPVVSVQGSKKGKGGVGAVVQSAYPALQTVSVGISGERVAQLFDRAASFSESISEIRAQRDIALATTAAAAAPNNEPPEATGEPEKSKGGAIILLAGAAILAWMVWN